MKIFTTPQIRAWDAYTIQHEPIASVELMNRAARAFTAWFMRLYPDTERPVYVFCGNGNNGGDGLIVAELLYRAFYPVVVVKEIKEIEEIRVIKEIKVHNLDEVNDDPNFFNGFNLSKGPILIDALFGTGLTRPLEGKWAGIVETLNNSSLEIVSIDLPSGLFADRHTDGLSVQARRTFSFETPKLAFFFPENAGRVGEWAYGSIGLHLAFAAMQETPYHFLTKADVQALIKPRGTFSHKGSFGQALLIAGSYGKMGAAVLSARAGLRSGVGLLTVNTPQCGVTILQTAVPEGMCLPDPEPDFWTQAPDIQRYSAIGVGPGLGQEKKTARALEELLRSTARPLVLDADALNLLAQHPEWWALLPPDSMLTPHPKEFERLFGQSGNDFERNELHRRKAREHRVFIILKGAYSAIAGPDGTCWFNSTGNPGMATGGSGDVLTGILTGLLAQGYTPSEACRLGVYLHGLAGDLAAAAQGEAALLAGDIVDYMGKAWMALKEV